MSDLISREAVLAIIEREEFKGDAIAEIEKLQSVENKGDLVRQAEDYENEIEGLQNRLDIAEYDKERLREEVTSLEAKLSSDENKCFDGMTNGEVIQAVFDVMVLTVKDGKVWVEKIYFPFDEVWWNAPYKAKR